MSVFELAQCLPRLKRIGLVRVRPSHRTISSLALHALVLTALTQKTGYKYHRSISLHPGRTHISRTHPSLILRQHIRRRNPLALTTFTPTDSPQPDRRTRVSENRFASLVSSATQSEFFFYHSLRHTHTEPDSNVTGFEKDFNAHQRQAFCVYSGKGVSELRYYLAALYTQITANTRTRVNSASATDDDLGHNITITAAPIGPNLAVFNSMPDTRTMAAAMAAARQQANPQLFTRRRLPKLSLADFLATEPGRDLEGERRFNRALTLSRTMMITAPAGAAPVPSTSAALIEAPSTSGLMSPIPLPLDAVEVDEEDQPPRPIWRRRSDVDIGGGGGGETNALAEAGSSSSHRHLEIPDRGQSVSPMEISDDERPPP